jgi:hypothetical protein
VDAKIKSITLAKMEVNVSAEVNVNKKITLMQLEA